MNIQVGIDLGTTNTAVCYLENGNLEQIKFRNSDNLPSTLLFLEQKVSIGDLANRKSVTYPRNYIKSSKTYIADADKRWTIEGREFNATDVAAEILSEVVKTIRKTKPEIDNIEAVITVPAYFTSTQIDETKKAGERAGLVVSRIITEPVAAAIAYGFEDEVNQTLFVVDIGGGTFDTSILQVKNNNEFNTLAIDGDNRLGGDDFDAHIVDFILSSIRKEEGVDLASLEKSGLSENDYYRAYHALVKKAEEVKKELSEYQQADIEIANLFPGFSFSASLTRKKFEQISASTINKIKKTIERTIEESKVGLNDIDKVVLVGGSAKIPVIHEFVSAYFDQAPFSDKPLDKLVAMGAAILAYKNDSVQNKDDIKINDILSHSLGIEVIGNRLSKILNRGTIYPAKQSELFTTTSDFQKYLNISVYEGEDVNNVHNNSPYGGFELTDIEHALAGQPSIEVTFEFDINRILKVTARDKKTNASRSQEISINKTI